MQLEQELLLEAQNLGLGAQFGAANTCPAISARGSVCRVTAMPSPVGRRSCSADRNIKAKINRDGIWIEKLDSNREIYP